MATAGAVLFALAAACAFGVAAFLQHRVASTASDDDVLRLRLVAGLVRERRWVFATGLAAFSYGLQAVALSLGPLVLVAPIAGLDLLFALPLVARARGRRLTAVEWAGGFCVAGGVAVFLAVSPPTAGLAAPPLSRWLPAIAAVAGIVVVGGAVSRRLGGRIAPGALLAAVAAVDFGLIAALTKTFVDQLGEDGLLAVLGRWEPWALLVAGCVGIVLSQSAFQAGTLAVSLPVIDTLEPISGVVLGATVLREHLAGSAGPLAAQLLGACVAVAGIVVLDRTSLSRKEPAGELQA